MAQTSLGQRDVRATPLQMALVAAGIANEGVVMRPYLVEAVLDADGAGVEATDPAVLSRFITADAAASLAEMMEQAVISGTGWRAAVPGLKVAGKTGTAEVPGGAPHVWFIGFASVQGAPDGGTIAIAVLVESGGDRGEDGTGGSVAAPIAGAVFEAWRDG